jgi:hypothetical protein
LVYVDGDHRFNGAFADLTAAKALVTNGGFICGDDLELQVPDFDTEHALTLAQKDHGIDPKTSRSFHAGVSLAVHRTFGRRISCKEGFGAQKQSEEQWSDVELFKNVPHFVDLMGKCKCTFPGIPTRPGNKP